MSSVRPLPERLRGPGDMLVRRWVPEDAEALGRAVTESVEHLRPWMEWVVQEPMSVAQRAEMIEIWERDWASGGDVVLGVFLGDRIVGGCGLHHRLGPEGLEIGYWVHVDHLRRGVASTTAALLTDAAFARPEIMRVQIRHDKANLRSRAVPHKLGFTLVEEVVDGIEAPAEVGVSCHWQMTRDEWSERGPLLAALAQPA